MKDTNKISDEALENVNGGMIVYAEGLPEYDPFFFFFFVENNNCRVFGKF